MLIVAIIIAVIFIPITTTNLKPSLLTHTTQQINNPLPNNPLTKY